MAIKQWIENGKTHYQIDVCVRSPHTQSIRIQKRESGLINDIEPEIVAKKLKRIEEQLKEDGVREAYERELAGISWIDLVNKWERSLRQEILEGKDPKEGESLLKKRGQGTLEAYLQSVRDFTDHWNDRPAAQITPADVEELFKRMARMGYSNSRQYNVKVAINQCFRFGIMNRYLKGVTVSPTYGFGISRKESRRPEILNAPQIETLLFEARRQNHPWRTIWEGAYHIGFRSGEGQELRAKDVDLFERRVHIERQYHTATKSVQNLKDGEWRQVSINDDLYELLQELGVPLMAPEDHIFPKIKAWRNGEAARVLREFCEKLGLPSICLHTLRACWATQLLKNGVDRLTLMAMGGWSDLETMERYIRLAGIEVRGATDSLSIRGKERPARVLKLMGTGQ